MRELLSDWGDCVLGQPIAARSSWARCTDALASGLHSFRGRVGYACGGADLDAQAAQGALGAGREVGWIGRQDAPR